MQWITGKRSITDALTKRIFEMYKKLHQIMPDGIMKQGLLAYSKRITFEGQSTEDN